MRVITLASQKGGCGKTTIAINLAVAAFDAGQRVAILDLDPQASARDWFTIRTIEGPEVLSLSPSELERALALAKQQRVDLVVIDTPGRDDAATAPAIRAASLVLVPCRPTMVDMKAMPTTWNAIQTLGKRAAFIINQTPTKGFRISDTKTALEYLGAVAPLHFVARAAYQDAYRAGLGVIEFEPDGKAADEVRELWKWTSQQLKKSNP